MKTIEKLALALVIAWVVQMVATPFWMNYILNRMSPPDTESYETLKAILAGVAVIGTYGTAIICCLWLHVEAKAHLQSKWVWTALGLMFQIKAIPVFYGYVILNRMTQQKKSGEQTLPPGSGTRGTPAAYAPDAPGIPER